MRNALLIGLVGLCLAGCANEFTPEQQAYQSALNRQATAKVQIEVAEQVAQFDPPSPQDIEKLKRLKQLSRQDLGAPQPFRDLIITTGTLSQPYEALGTVEADTTDIGLSTSDLRDIFFRPPAAVAIQGHSPKLRNPQMDERLKA